MGKICRTCKKAVNANEKSYNCVSFNCDMHMTLECGARLPAAVISIKKNFMNVTLLYNNYVEQNERDNFICYQTLANLAEKFDSLDVGEKMKNMERRLTDLLGEKIGNATKTTCDKVEKKYMLLSLLF